MTSCCFTGHRNIKIKNSLKSELNKVLCTLIKKGVSHFYLGGAQGWDTLCAICLYELKKLHPHIEINLILPCPPDEQCAMWNQQATKLFNNIYKAADNIDIVTPHLTDKSMKYRNQRLVDKSDICLCYFNNSRKRSGTAQTVRMAEAKGIKVINFYPLSTDT